MLFENYISSNAVNREETSCTKKSMRLNIKTNPEEPGNKAYTNKKTKHCESLKQRCRNSTAPAQWRKTDKKERQDK